MKTHIASIIILLFSTLSFAQNMDNKSIEQRIAAIEDKTAIKNVVDEFSILSDQKEAIKQTLLFTEDATVQTLFNGQIISSLKGRKQIGETFAAFLNKFETVYHINGQQTVTLNGDKATGISYCAVTLIGVENGKKIKTSIGVYYHDEFVRRNGQWLIANRKATFAWQDKQPME
jgi:hypothetical protein